MQHKADPDDALAAPSFRWLYLLTFAVALLVASDLLFWWLGYESLRNPWGVNLSLIAAVAGGARIVYGAVTALLEGDVGADLALAIALIAALLLKEYWVGAEVVLIAMVGESLEAITFSRTRREIRRILELRPRNVRVRRDDQEAEVAVEDVQIGDVVVIRPGERIPVDGTVLVGRSSIDQSTLTGESLPVDKGEGDSVYAGTMNQFGALQVRTDVVGDDTTLGQVIQLVAEAQRHKARVERIADQLARCFLPFVLACALATLVYTNFAAVRSLDFSSLSQWVWMPTLAVLVVACPCALILATPAAMMAALAWLARRGVLTTGGAALEQLATVSRIAFDKTGTLTEGKLQLGECAALGDHNEEDVLLLAALAEQSSEHLIARVIVQAAKDRGLRLAPVEDFQAMPGAGISAHLPGDASPPSGRSGARLLVGNRRLMSERGVAIGPEVDAAMERLERSAQTPLLVCRDDEIVGLIGVRDTVRPEAARVIGELRELGVQEIVLLTGDRRAAAAQVAHAVGIDRYEAELRPDEKAHWLARWRQPLGGGSATSGPIRVAMVGDGVNDAPALASADVGLALAGVGSDLAAEAGDLILMGAPLTPLPGLLRLSRETVRIIRQNIILFAFVVNFLGIVITAWIMPSWSPTWLRRSPVAAALFHQVGSVLVLLNAMRLLWFERWHQGMLGRTETSLAGACGGCLRRLNNVASAGRWMWRRRRGLIRAAAALLLAAYFTQAVVFVGPDEAAIVKRFGRCRAVLGSGPHLRLPPPWETVIKEKPARIRTVEVGFRRMPDDAQSLAPIEWASPHEEGALRLQESEAIMLTGDQSLVKLGAAVQYRIRDLRAYLFQVRDPDRMLRTVAESVIREVLAARPLMVDDNDGQGQKVLEILTAGRGAIEEEIRLQTQARINALKLGVKILPRGVCLQDVHPPLPVVSAFRDVSSAIKEKERMKNEANADYRDKVIKAGGFAAYQELSASQTEVTDELWAKLRPQLRGEASATIAAAEAFAAQQEYHAAGTAERFLLTEAARAASPQLTEWRMFLDTLEAAMPGKNKLILDGRTGGRRHLLLGFPQNKNSSLPQLLGSPAMSPSEHE